MVKDCVASSSLPSEYQQLDLSSISSAFMGPYCFTFRCSTEDARATVPEALLLRSTKLSDDIVTYYKVQA